MARTVIVADDDLPSGDAIAEVLDAAGFAVTVARDGRGALAAVRAAPRPCVLVLDLMLPDVHGWDVARALREDAATADVPVVACTAAAGFVPPPAVRFLPKPFGVDELLDAVEAAFAAAAADAPAPPAARD